MSVLKRLVITLLLVPAFTYATVMPSWQEYADYLAKVVDDSINSIHATVPNSKITHADVLAIMCMEQQSLNISKNSSAGARGLTQVMPSTFDLYARANKDGFQDFVRRTACNPAKLSFDARCSIEAGARIFNSLLIRYNGDRTKAAIAYNGGPGRVGKSRLPKETYDYAFRKLPACLNPIVSGKSPVANRIWKRLVQKVGELTGGRFALQGFAKFVPHTAGSQPFDSFDSSLALQDAKPKGFIETMLDKTGLSSLFKSQGYQTNNTQSAPSSPSVFSRQNNVYLANNNGSEVSEKPLQFSDFDLDGSNTEYTFTYKDRIEIVSDVYNNILSSPYDSMTKFGAIKNTSNNTYLSCFPNKLYKNEEYLIVYQCPSSYKAYINDTEHSSTNAILKKVAHSDTQIKLKCKNNKRETVKTCNIKVKNPQITQFSAKYDKAQVGEDLNLVWSAKDMNNCYVFELGKQITQGLSGKIQLKISQIPYATELLCLDFMDKKYKKEIMIK